MDKEDSVPADGDDGQEEPGLVEQGVAERSGLDELAAQLSKPSKRMADAGSMEVSEAMADLDEVLESELKRLKPTVPSLLKMPWEMGFAGMVLGGSEVSLVPARVRVGIQAPTGKVPEVPEVLEVEDRKEGVPQSLFQRRAEHKQSKPWKLEEEDRRSRAKTSWLVIIRAMGKVTPVFDMIDAEGEGVLDDIFARKKTGTLEVRASAILLYIRWCSSKGFQAFPCTESPWPMSIWTSSGRTMPRLLVQTAFGVHWPFAKGAWWLKGWIPSCQAVASLGHHTGATWQRGCWGKEMH